MPYSATGGNLPAHVKKLSAKSRRQWVHIWNSVYADTQDEKKAFMAANGVVKGSKSVKVYTDHSDPDLPAEVRALPSTLRRRYVGNHNYHIMENGDPEAAHQYAQENTYMSLAEGLALANKRMKSNDSDEDEPPNEEESDDIEVDDKKKVRSSGATTKSSGGVLSNIAQFFKNLGSLNEATPSIDTVSPWIFYRDSTGALRGLVVYSNIFKDKHKEIISEAAHKEYVEWADEHGAYPEMHLWHGGPGTRWGQVDFVDYTDGFAVAGFVVDAGKEYIAEALQKQENKVSHGFFGLKDVTSVFLLYRPFEISPLPNGAEANTWTAISFASKEYQMPFSDAKKGYFKKLGMSDEAITDAEAKLKDMGDKLKAAGADYKDAADPAADVQPMAVLVTEMANIGKSVSQLAELISTQNKELVAVKTQVTAFEAESKKSVDDRVNEQLTSRVAAAVGSGGFKASESAGTVVAEAQAKEAGVKANDEGTGLDWLFNNVLPNQLGGLAGTPMPAGFSAPSTGAPAPVASTGGN